MARQVRVGWPWNSVRPLRVLNFTYAATGPESKSRFRFDRFNFSEESLVAIRQERINHVEQGAQPNTLSVRRPATVRCVDAASKI